MESFLILPSVEIQLLILAVVSVVRVDLSSIIIVEVSVLRVSWRRVVVITLVAFVVVVAVSLVVQRIQ